MLEFFKNINLAKSIICADLDAKRMQMGWRDSTNKVDCRVYLMWQMESYLGQEVSKWDCRFTNPSLDFLGYIY